MKDIFVKKVSKAYGEKSVLRDFSMQISAGEVVAIMGPSGCGKTTLMRILAGLEVPDSGEIEGIDIKRLSVVFQEDRLIENISALRNVAMVMDGSGAVDEARRILEGVQLKESAEKRIRHLSGGMARRVAIGRALAAEADVILMDEPFKGLDEQTREGVIEFIRGYVKGKTVMIITHAQEEAEMLNARVIRMGYA